MTNETTAPAPVWSDQYRAWVYPGMTLEELTERNVRARLRFRAFDDAWLRKRELEAMLDAEIGTSA